MTPPKKLTAALIALALILQPKTPAAAPEPTTDCRPRPARPTNEPPQLLAMVAVVTDHGQETAHGLGTHLGNGLIITTHHGHAGRPTTIIWNGRTYPAIQLAEDPTIDAALFQCQAPFTTQLPLTTAPPRPGDWIWWQSNAGRYITTEGHQHRLAGASRMGDSGSPCWSAQGMTGMITDAVLTCPPQSLATTAAAIERFIAPHRTPKTQNPPPPIPTKQPDDPLASLPPVRLQIIDNNGNVLTEGSAPLGQPIRLRLKQRPKEKDKHP